MKLHQCSRHHHSEYKSLATTDIITETEELKDICNNEKTNIVKVTSNGQLCHEDFILRDRVIAHIENEHQETYEPSKQLQTMPQQLQFSEKL